MNIAEIDDVLLEQRSRRIRDILGSFLNPEEMALLKEVRLRENQDLHIEVREGTIAKIVLTEVRFSATKSQ